MISPLAKVSGMLAEGSAAGLGRKIYIDATAPFAEHERYARGKFESIDLSAWPAKPPRGCAAGRATT